MTKKSIEKAKLMLLGGIFVMLALGVVLGHIYFAADLAYKDLRLVLAYGFFGFVFVGIIAYKGINFLKKLKQKNF